MTEKWLSIQEVRERIGKSIQTITDYCNEGKFPRATKPGGGKWAIPEGDVDAFMTGKPLVIAPAPAQASENVQKAKENAEIAEANQKKAEAEAAEVRAKKEIEAAMAGFASAEEWEKAQKEFNELIKRVKDELEIEKQTTSHQKQKYEDGITVNSEHEKQLKEQLKLVSEQITEQENIKIEAKKATEDNIARILKHFKGGTVGLMEKAVYNLTSPVVTRAYVEYRCPDCHKDGSDNINRLARFELPRLEDCPPHFVFRICADCENDQRNNRNLPYYVCDICPIDKMMKEAAKFIVDALATVGVKAEFDGDGQYKPTTYIDEKKRHLSKEEQVRLLMQGYGVVSDERQSDDKKEG